MATQVLGLLGLRKKARRLPQIVRDEVQKSLEAAADGVVALARSLVPVEDGDLRDSIGWTWGDPPRGAIVLGQSRPMKSAGDMRLSIYAGDDRAFYARWVEFGTAPHSTAKGADRMSKRRSKGGRMHPGAKAHPFFFPAWRAHRKRVKSRVSRAITRGAKKVAATK